jgi:hypothetical protein
MIGVATASIMECAGRCRHWKHRCDEKAACLPSRVANVRPASSEMSAITTLAPPATKVSTFSAPMQLTRPVMIGVFRLSFNRMGMLAVWEFVAAVRRHIGVNGHSTASALRSLFVIRNQRLASPQRASIKNVTLRSNCERRVGNDARWLAGMNYREVL